MSWKRKILRRIYGPVFINGTWRMESSRECHKKILGGRPEGKSSIGRPRLRWLDDVNDLKSMGVRQWRKKAEDRGEWTRKGGRQRLNLKGPYSRRRRSTNT
jgi:hypothetical protein